jgi:hypothetical protein
LPAHIWSRASSRMRRIRARRWRAGSSWVRNVWQQQVGHRRDHKVC